MPTDPTILAQLQTLWGEPVTLTTSEADGEAAFVPIEPFCLWPGAWVVDAAKFYRSLDAGIASGPEGPRGRYGGLSHDLNCLRNTTCLSDSQCR